jgi:outer membrane protein assembly factor BamB
VIRVRASVASVLVLILAVAACSSVSRARDGQHDSTPPSSEPSSVPSPSDPCNTGRGAALTVLNADGSKRWAVDLPAGDGTEVAPAPDGDVIFSGHAGSLSAIHAADGSAKWSSSLGSSIYNVWMVDGLLVVNVDQVSENAKIVGVDPATGATRWIYQVPGGGFLGDAVLTGDGGLAFRTSETGTLVALDLTSGRPRWSKHVPSDRNGGGLPSAASGLVVYVDSNRQIVGLDARSGAVRWQQPAGQSGRVVISGNVGVVVPQEVSGNSITVVAHSLGNGAEKWRRQLADISGVFPDREGLVLIDYRDDTVTLAAAATADPIWTSRLGKIDDLDRAPVSVGTDGTLVVPERSSLAFLDRSSGHVRHVSLPVSGGRGYVAAGNEGVLAVSGTEARLVTPDAVTWTTRLPHFAQSDPAVLADGGLVIQTEDPMCASW